MMMLKVTLFHNFLSKITVNKILPLSNGHLLIFYDFLI